MNTGQQAAHWDDDQEIGFLPQPTPPQPHNTGMPQPASRVDIQAALNAGLSPEEIEELEILLDPIKWAYVNLGWEPYDYQEPVLRILPDTSSAVFRFARRTGKSEMVCLLILWYAYTQFNKKETNASNEMQYRILIITPFETQIDTIFDRLTQLIGASTTLQGSIVKHNKHDIRLNNGSHILGLTAGTKNNQGAVSTRSKGADVLVLDECIAETTLIETPKGEVQVKDINIGDTVYSYLNGEIVEKTVTNKKMTGIKPAILLKTETGTEIICTRNHPMKTKDGWENAEHATEVALDMKIGRYCQGSQERLARLVGYNTGDGWVSKDVCRGAGFAGEIDGLEYIKSDINALIPNEWKMTTYSRQTMSPQWGIKGSTNHFTVGNGARDLIISHGTPIGKKTEQAFSVPEFVITGTNTVKAEYLAALMGAEGDSPCFQVNGITPHAISFVMHKNAEFLKEHVMFFEQLKSLYKDLGIKCNLSKPKKKEKTYRLELVIKNSLENQIRFLSIVGYRYNKEKEEKAFLMLRYLLHKKHLINVMSNYCKLVKILRRVGLTLDAIYKEVDVNNYTIQSWLYRNSVPSLPKSEMETYSEWLKDNYVDGIYYDNVVCIKKAGEQEVYNLTVEDSHTYIANSIITHNCDYMSEEDITNVRNIRNEDPKRIRMIVASTPAGKRESYYYWCTEASTSYHADGEYLEKTGVLRYKVITAKDKGIRGNGWTEFYAPSQVNRKLLEFNQETQQTYLDDLKDSLPSYRYDQEVLALFGEEVLGVYQKRFIDYAILQGANLQCGYAAMRVRSRRPGNIRILGVDWDKISAETSLLAYEYDTILEKFIPLDKIAIPRSQLTYALAVQKIIELNQCHDFDWIVIDRGHGSLQMQSYMV